MCVCVSVCGAYFKIFLSFRPPSVAWEVRKITSPSKPHTSQHARSLQAGAKHTNPSQPGAKRFLNFRTHKQSTENCSEVMVAQAPPTNVTMTTAQMGTKTTGTVPQTSSVVVARETHTQIAVAEETCHHHDEDAAATVAQDELTSAPPSQLPSIGGAKVVTSAPSHAVAPSTLSWADRVKGKLDHSKISGPPATSSGGAHNLIRASRGEASKALSPASSSVVAAKGKVAEPGDGWELACSRSRPGRRSRRLRSGNTGVISGCSFRLKGVWGGGGGGGAGSELFFVPCLPSKASCQRAWSFVPCEQ